MLSLPCWPSPWIWDPGCLPKQAQITRSNPRPAEHWKPDMIRATTPKSHPGCLRRGKQWGNKACWRHNKRKRIKTVSLGDYIHHHHLDSVQQTPEFYFHTFDDLESSGPQYARLLLLFLQRQGEIELLDLVKTIRAGHWRDLKHASILNVLLNVFLVLIKYTKGSLLIYIVIYANLYSYIYMLICIVKYNQLSSIMSSSFSLLMNGFQHPRECLKSYNTKPYIYYAFAHLSVRD